MKRIQNDSTHAKWLSSVIFSFSVSLECGKRMCDRFDLVIDDFQLFLLFNLLPWDCVKCIYVFKRRICAENGRYQFEIRRLVDIMRAWNTDVKSFCHKISLQPLHLLLCCLLIVVSLCLVFFFGKFTITLLLLLLTRL